MIFFREKGDQGGGVGKALFIDGTGKYKNLLGIKCKFVARYYDKANFININVILIKKYIQTLLNKYSYLPT